MESKQKKENIQLISEEAQRTILSRHNQTKLPNQKIPIVPRNLISGWPLIQASFFSSANGNGYIPTLRGANCHDFKLGAFSLAALLAKINTHNIIEGNNEPATINDFSLTNVQNFLENFYFSSKTTGIAIESRDRDYSKTLAITLPWESKSPHTLCDVMIQLERKIFNKEAGIEVIGKHEDSKPYTKEFLSANINSTIAAFTHGQVFVDLGLLLDKYVNDPQTKEYFESIFKVKEFLQLKIQEPGLKPSADKMADNSNLLLNKPMRKAATEQTVSAMKAVKK